MPQRYEIAIRLMNGTDVVPEIPDGMKVGDTVRYASADGDVMIEFAGPEGSPFLDASGRQITKISDSQPHELKRQGGFDCRCTLTLRDGRRLGWSSGSERSGGHTTVGGG